MPEVTVIGGGLAGSEAAWQAAELGCSVELWEMRPVKQTPLTTPRTSPSSSARTRSGIGLSKRRRGC